MSCIRKTPSRQCVRDISPHWGWMVVVAAFVTNFIVVGLSNSSGLYYTEWMDHFQSSSGVTAWIGSMNIGLLCLAGPFASFLVGHFGDRKVVIVGGLLAAVGLISSSFVENVYVLMVTYGIITGVGFSFCFNSMATVPMFFFTPESAGLAIGLAMSGGGCGSFIMPLLIQYLVKIFGWKGSLLILGGLTLNVVVCGALLRSPSMPDEDPPPIGTRRLRRRSSVVKVSLLKNCSFLLFILHQTLFTIGSSVVYVHVSAVIEILTGEERFHCQLALTMIGVANFFGRIIQGGLGGLKCVNVMSQYLLSYLIVGGVILAFPSVPYFPVLLFLCGVFGFCTAPYATLVQLIAVKIAGLHNLKVAYSMFLFMCGIGLLVGAPIAGILYDVTKRYGTSMYFGGTSVILCVLVMIKPWYDDIKTRINLRKMRPETYNSFVFDIKEKTEVVIVSTARTLNEETISML
ncbi:monocarboxylate transporter 13-like [Lineus longissimus]|uniref:monocarboxylate transporter 13-like n=1 Tax=Lineus longissimus TaxID=88925 RepID=UPI00315DE438